MKHTILLTLTLLAAAALAGCAHAPVAGEVVGKAYSPPHYESRTRFYGHYGYGFHRHYGFGIAYEYPEYVGPSYQLRLLTWKYDKDDARWEPRRRAIDVEQPIFDDARPGDWFSYEPNRRVFDATRHFSRSLRAYPVGVVKDIPRETAMQILHGRRRLLAGRPATQPATRPAAP